MQLQLDLKGSLKMIRRVPKMFFLLVILNLFLLKDNIFGEELPERIDGKDRFEVSVKLSQKWSGSQTVILANYKAYADALSAGPLAYKEDAPILLTQKDKLTSITKEEIKRLKPGKVIIVGGPGSVSINIENELKLTGVKIIERMSGRDRFQVAENIALKLNSWNKAVIAYGLNFPDALAISPYAARNQYPILLTKTNSLPESTHNLIKNKKVKETMIVGGEGSVSKSVEAVLPNPFRIGGKDRFEVAANIANEFFPLTEKVYLATGMSFADALTGSVLAAKQNAPIMLTAASFVPKETLGFFEEHLVKEYTILGGEGSVSSTLVSDIHFYKNTTQPVIYFVPHADDEVLTYGIDIVNQLNRNRDVKLVLLTKGDDSTVRDMLNGHFDHESIYGVMNLRIKCNWHNVYHDPVTEQFLHGHISMAEFGDIRVEEYQRATEALGIKSDNAQVNIIPLENLTTEELKGILRSYLHDYPLADFRTMSMHDLHPQHAIIGKALWELEQSGEVNPIQTNYFMSVYTDHMEKKAIDLPLRTLNVNSPELNEKIDLASDMYKEYNPEHGFYASGYHSVARQFNLIKSNRYIRIHH